MIDKTLYINIYMNEAMYSKIETNNTLKIN